ncbi:uncharacterized protein LOC112561059 [Pomacea canaliculata]|uniref:uncharacterized protein LOC112561059 n=1 Tax=Pomacea canaliculata TaxID=400727 RepID=UPI000D73EEF7|nr:uncharacterized protein LOC112561059 [Pomacea canaliculata]
METLDRSFVLNLPAVQAVLQLESTLQESRVLNAVAKVLKSLAQPTHHDSRPPAPPAAAAAECFITSGVNAWAAQNLRAKAILEELEVLGEEDSETVGFAFVDAGTKRDSGDTFSDPGSTSAARKDPQADVVSEDSASTVSSSSSSTVASKCGNADICVDGEEISETELRPGTNPVGQNTKNRDFTDHGDRKAEALLLRKRMDAAATRKRRGWKRGKYARVQGAASGVDPAALRSLPAVRDLRVNDVHVSSLRHHHSC